SRATCGRRPPRPAAPPPWVVGWAGIWVGSLGLQRPAASVASQYPSPSVSAPLVPAHWPLVQTSPSVQSLPSSHAKPSRAGPSCTHPVTVSQESTVQVLWSSQSGGAPPTQELPPSQVSLVVQALPSSQAVPAVLNWHVAAQQLG